MNSLNKGVIPGGVSSRDESGEKLLSARKVIGGISNAFNWRIFVSLPCVEHCLCNGTTWICSSKINEKGSVQISNRPGQCHKLSPFTSWANKGDAQRFVFYPFRECFCLHLTFSNSLGGCWHFSSIIQMRLVREEHSPKSLARCPSFLVTISSSTSSKWASRWVSSSSRNWCSCLNSATIFSLAAFVCVCKKAGKKRKKGYQQQEEKQSVFAAS